MKLKKARFPWPWNEEPDLEEEEDEDGFNGSISYIRNTGCRFSE